MRREGTIGAATVLAIAAVIGVSLRTGPKQEGSGRADQTSAIKRSRPSISKKVTHRLGSGCGSLEAQLEEFLEIKELVAPEQCYEPGDASRKEPQQDLTQKTSQLKFVIALMPDPVHTHLPVLFDQFAVAIQEGAQDERYEFDSSWLPWDEEESSYALLADQKAANSERELKENQPGIILFRKQGALSRSYHEALVVFVVGEEATQGIHKEQFRNALAWIESLKPKAATKIGRVAILGPTFSGSFPSLTQLLFERKTTELLDLGTTRRGLPLAIFSGSVSGQTPAHMFQNTFESQVAFHSFVQNDDEILERFCSYMQNQQPGFDPGRIAIISEDETAYGGSGMKLGTSELDEHDKAPKNDKSDCARQALRLYYPRDISALRGAYQTKSLFDVGTSPQPAETQRRNLPTDLADPSGRVHDSIRSYGGNQTPLTQEAFLLEIVAALRELNARYIFLRSSNTLDQLFLTNFLRRGYPDGRIVIFGSDLMFIRERGSTGLGGAMTLSTYPLFPLERDWTEHQSLPAADRVFSSDTTEGTYVAIRLLLNDESLLDEKADPYRCHVVDKQGRIFLPWIACATDPPIPDYSAPFWTLADQCGEVVDGDAETTAKRNENCLYQGPATWLSVIGANRFWPMASLTDETPNPPPVDPKTPELAKRRKSEPGERPEIPLGMKVFLLGLLLFSVFHAWCCWSGSYTAKPAFRAHFASTGEKHHAWLVFGGSCCVAFLAIVAGWGCGLFSTCAPGLPYPWFALTFVSLVCLMAWGAILASNRTAWKLSQDLSSSSDLPRMTKNDLTSRCYRASGLFTAAVVLFALAFVLPIELVLLIENRVLTYWRAMHLTSGVSPIVPILLILMGMYLSFWFLLHGLALFGPDRPCLPSKDRLVLKGADGSNRDFLRMFSQEDAGNPIEQAAIPLRGKILWLAVGLAILFFAAASGIAAGIPVRSLGAKSYAIIFMAFLDICCTLAIVEAWRLCQVWEELRRLLEFIDRLPLRRTLASLRGFSWGGVWKMSGNVLEVRYKVISRQMECMNHTIASLHKFLKTSSSPDPEAQNSLVALTDMRTAGMTFAEWYSSNYANPLAGDLSSFKRFQESIASASGTLLTKLLVPAWRMEEASLVVGPSKDEKEKEEDASNHPPQPKDRHIQNAEEFVCLNYLGFIQNVLGRLRTMALTIILLFLVATVATSSYPFDPQQALSAVLIVLFVIVGAVIVKVYADMHRDATLSHVTKTKPGELGAEFWFKIVGFGFAPLIGLLTRIFPGITDFIFSWLQPGISSLK
jgi:hypothetical protein